MCWQKNWMEKSEILRKCCKIFGWNFDFTSKVTFPFFHHCVLWCARPQTLVEKQKEIDFHCWCYPCSDWNGRANEMEFSTTTGCPNRFGIRSEMFVSEASIVYEKNVFCSKKLLLKPCLHELQNKNGFFKQLFSYLLNE